MKRLALAFLTLSLLTAAILWSPEGGTAQNKLPKNRVEITTRDGFRLISSNGIPDHEPGRFPNRNNPNTIRERHHNFRVPLEPQAARTLATLTLGKFGIAVNGIPSDPGAAEFWNRDPNSGWQYEAKGGAINLGLDGSNAHVQPDGAYHYHGIPSALIAKRGNGKSPALVGYAADGYPIYGPLGYSDPKDASSPVRVMKSSYRVKRGARPSGPRGSYDGSFVQDFEFVEGLGDLDECNGRTAATPESPNGEYHYVLTEDFPFIPRKFHGTPDQSFRPGPPGGGPGGPGGGPGGGPRGQGGPPGFGPPPGGPGGRPGPPPRRGS